LLARLSVFARGCGYDLANAFDYQFGLIDLNVMSALLGYDVFAVGRTPRILFPT